jgi:solute carrier family 8 (sodium/calcium exchanger)
VQFSQDHFGCVEGQDEYARVFVERVKGSAGDVRCKWHTEDVSATGGVDFEPVEAGELVMLHSEVKKELLIKITNDESYEKSEKFRVVLTDVQGARFSADTDGGEEKCICYVTIKNNDANVTKVNALVDFFQKEYEANKVGGTNWYDQITAALYVDGDAEAQAEAGPADWVLHILFFPFKIVFAIVVPPTDFLGGFATFVMSLVMIGLLTALVGDFAGFLGCSMDMPDDVTAITLVALGTSLPDTFASMTAAKNDPYADGSIGNVMGSNSVNVFLGLGLPWTVGAIYWSNPATFEATYGSGPDAETNRVRWLNKKYRDQTYGELGFLDDHPNGAFMVPAGSLGFQVMVFAILAVICILFLAFRRVKCGGELGGKTPDKQLSSLFLAGLWILYVALATWNSLRQTE